MTMLAAEATLLTSNGRLDDALQVAERMLDAATQWGEEAFVAHAHWLFGLIYHLMGKPREAECHFDWVLGWLTPERGAELRAAFGYDVTAHTLAFSAVDQWLLGYPEKALRRSTRAVTGALEHGDLYGQACASAVGAITLFLLRSERVALQERSELCYRLCSQQGFASWQAYAEIFLRWLAVLRGDADGDAGIEQIRSAIAAWQSTGMAIGVDSLVVVLADGCLASARRCQAGDPALRAGRLDVALAAIEPLLEPEVSCGQCYQAELYRMRGELLLERDGGAVALAAADEAVACFQMALQIAREMGALAWELRAAMSQVRLRLRQGEANGAELVDARACLSEVYGHFTEGFEFPDLQEAAALIGEAG